MLAVLTVAAQLAIVAHVPDTVFACDAIDVTVAVSAKGRAVPSLAVPTFLPFDLLRGTSSPRVDYGSGSDLIAEYRFTITTDRVGHFVIPSFEARLGELRAVSRPLAVAVRPPRGRGIPIVVARARIDTSGEVNLRVRAAADTVFVGQQATYEVAVFLNQTARDRLRRNPTFYPPEMQAMLAYDLPAPPATRRRGGATSGGSQCFDALVYRRALFPLVSGRLVIPPAQLVYSTGLSSSSLFSREESHELQTDSVTIVAIDPPAEGRPAEYSGAVGDVRLDAHVDSSPPRIGDPMLFTVRIEGTGNVKLFPRPAVAVPWAALVAADERVRIDSTNPRIGGIKEFDWVLTPRIAGEFDVPPVRYGYFDPGQRRYETAVAAGTYVRVASGTPLLASADTGNAESALSIRNRYGGPASPPLQSLPAFWLIMALIPVPAIAARWRQRSLRPKRRVAQDPLRALSTATLEDPIMLRRYFVRALANRLGCHPQDFTHPGALQRALRRSGVSESTAARAESLLRNLDGAAYARTGALPPGAAREASDLARAIDVEALARTELPFWVPALIVALSLGIVAGVMAADTAAMHFARGVSAYVREDFNSARASFAEAVTQAPTSPDAWANYGTASWAVADTAAAVLGWRQALAIEPDADDLQQRMGLVREEGPNAPGWVPSLPRNATVYLFAILWLAAWWAAWVSRRPHGWAGRLSLPIAACALVVGLVSIEIETRVAGSRLAVVRHAASLTSEPAIGMDRGPTVGTGEIVRIAGRRGTWTRIEASDDRDGWIASSQLFPVAERHLPRD